MRAFAKIVVEQAQRRGVEVVELTPAGRPHERGSGQAGMGDGER